MSSNESSGVENYATALKLYLDDCGQNFYCEFSLNPYGAYSEFVRRTARICADHWHEMRLEIASDIIGKNMYSSDIIESILDEMPEEIVAEDRDYWYILIKSIGISYSSEHNDSLEYALRLLSPLLAHKDLSIVEAAIDALEEVGEDEAIDLVGQLVNHPESRISSYAKFVVEKYSLLVLLFS